MLTVVDVLGGHVDDLGSDVSVLVDGGPVDAVGVKVRVVIVLVTDLNGDALLGWGGGAEVAFKQRLEPETSG